MKTKNIIIDQHYVPKCFLKNHTNSKDILWCYDKKFDKIKKVYPTQTAKEKRMYDYNDDGSQKIENTFSKLESKWSPVILTFIDDVISNKNNFKLSSTIKDVLFDFIIYQIIRTKNTKENIKQIKNSLINEYEEYASDKLLKDMNEWDIEQAFVDLINGDIAERFKKNNYEWTILLNKNDRHVFYTSDVPVVTYKNDNADLSEPLSMFIAFHPKVAISIVPVLNDNITIKDKFKLVSSYNQIRNYNELQVNESYRYVYCAKKEFKLIDKIKKDKEINNTNVSKIESEMVTMHDGRIISIFRRKYK